jgi:hypothetical protein
MPTSDQPDPYVVALAVVTMLATLWGFGPYRPAVTRFFFAVSASVLLLVVKALAASSHPIGTALVPAVMLAFGCLVLLHGDPAARRAAKRASTATRRTATSLAPIAVGGFLVGFRFGREARSVTAITATVVFLLS